MVEKGPAAGPCSTRRYRGEHCEQRPRDSRPGSMAHAHDGHGLAHIGRNNAVGTSPPRPSHQDRQQRPPDRHRQQQHPRHQRTPHAQVPRRPRRSRCTPWELPPFIRWHHESSKIPSTTSPKQARLDRTNARRHQGLPDLPPGPGRPPHQEVLPASPPHQHPPLRRRPPHLCPRQRQRRETLGGRPDCRRGSRLYAHPGPLPPRPSHLCHAMPPHLDDARCRWNTRPRSGSDL